MSETPESTTETIATPPTAAPVAHRDNRLNHVLAWVGIIAGILFIVGVVFFSGFIAGRATDGYGWHRGVQNSQLRPDATMGGGCPMMQGGGMGPGGMGQGGMGPGGMPGGMGPGRTAGPAPTSSMPMAPPAGNR